MKRLWKWIALAAVVVIAAGGFGFWYFWLRDDAPPEAALPDRPAASSAAGSTAASAAAADGEWTVVRDPEVFVGYRVKEQFAGETITKTAVGRTPDVDGTVTVAGDEVTKGDFTADLSQLASDQSRRDNYLKGSSLETTKFPEATFVLTEPIGLGGPPTQGKELTVTAQGDLTLHGVTKAVELELSARWNGDTIDVAGQLPVQFADYGIDRPSVPILSTEDNGVMELQLTFQRA
jgi:polyisoprenoid-binding protein YceI